MDKPEGYTQSKIQNMIIRKIKKSKIECAHQLDSDVMETEACLLDGLSSEVCKLVKSPLKEKLGLLSDEYMCYPLPKLENYNYDDLQQVCLMNRYAKVVLEKASSR